MSDLDDIYCALQEGVGAAEALATWVRGADAHDRARSRLWTLRRGLTAYESLQRNLRDGRKHIDMPDDAFDDRPVAAGLEVADAGHKLCDVCGGNGVTMEARMYPSGHAEVDVACGECSGEGQVEIEEATTVTEGATP